ncbi:hypothetical protein ACFWGP_05565 [Agromyces sp. NPDC127015]|uniref:beta-sandwich lipoprotein n=1 Tax=Agromyces sp. NPDC127015 TaxID=3347108 RepID=UPI0036628736
MKHMKKIAAAALVAAAALTLAACTSDAENASYNLSKEADQFNIERRVVFYNGITNEFMLEMQGYCSITDEGNQLEVTCKEGPNEYTKDFLGLSDNVTYFVEQLETADVSLYHRKVIIKPENVLPEFDLEAGEQ